jgi:hypothetical protein
MRMTGWFALTASIYKLERLPDSREVMVAIKNRLSIVFISLKLPFLLEKQAALSLISKLQVPVITRLVVRFRLPFNF